MTATKRRPESRKRKLRSTPQFKKKAQDYNWGPEALSIFFAAIALFLLCSILAQQPLVLEGLGISKGAAQLLGPVGRFIGVLLFGALGWSSLVLVLWLTYLSVRSWQEELLIKNRKHPFWVLLLGAIGVLVSLSTVASIIWSTNGGGGIGMTVSRPLLHLFSTFGALLLTGSLFVLSLSFALGISVSEVGLLAWDLFTDVLVLLFVSLPLMVFGAVTFVLGRFLGGVSFVLEALLSEEVVDRISSVFAGFRKSKVRAVIARPSVRKSIVLDDADDNQDDDLDEEEYESEIHVRRRNGSTKVSQKELLKSRKRLEEGTPQADIFYTGTYQPPEINLLTQGIPAEGSENDDDLVKKSRQIEVKLRDFGISGRVTEVHPGPVITLFEFEPAAGVKVGRISALSDDLAMTLKSVSVRIVAPIPGKGTVGIEVPNQKREIVRLRDVLESPESVRAQSVLSVALGKDTYGDSVVADIATMPHLLIAGATGTGKSVCINAFLCSLLYKATPAELGLILIDPKILELSVYDGIPHLRVPVVTVPKQAKAVLDWAVHEMNRRYRLMQKVGVRGIDAYNRVVRGEDEPDAIKTSELEVVEPIISEQNIELTEDHVPNEELLGKGEEELVAIGDTLIPLPKIVIVIDELADLMLSVGREVEDLIARLAQKARAAGIHLIVATQRPSVDVITGLIKANFPARLSFQVSSRVDSRTIIDSMGAEKLLGQGDMLFMPPGVSSLRRVHGAFVSDTEVKRVVAALKKDCKPVYDQYIQELCEKAMKEDADGAEQGGSEEHDSLYDEAVRLVLEKGKASTSLIQRVLRIGYNRAARIMEMMEREGIIGPADGAKPREVIGSDL